MQTMQETAELGVQAVTDNVRQRDGHDNSNNYYYYYYYKLLYSAIN